MIDQLSVISTATLLKIVPSTLAIIVLESSSFEQYWNDKVPNYVKGGGQKYKDDYKQYSVFTYDYLKSKLSTKTTSVLLIILFLVEILDTEGSIRGVLGFILIILLLVTLRTLFWIGDVYDINNGKNPDRYYTYYYIESEEGVDNYPHKILKPTMVPVYLNLIIILTYISKDIST